MTAIQYGRVQVEYYHFLPGSKKKNIFYWSYACPDMTNYTMLKIHTHTHTHFQQINIYALDDTRYEGMLYLLLCRSVGI